MRALLCEDGKRGGPSSAESVRQGIERLYDGWETPATVEIVAFSFLSQPACMTELLMDADLFYFAGFFDAPAGLDDAMRNGDLLHLLRERVQCNCMGLFGVCGGAKLAGIGNGNNFGLPGLDLLNGIQVQYDAGVAAAQVTVDTNAELQTVQMTTGCALTFVMDETMQMGICFTCTKKTSPMVAVRLHKFRGSTEDY